MVEHLYYHHKVEGSSPAFATGTKREKIAKKLYGKMASGRST